jgi:hypothetical protein
VLLYIEFDLKEDALELFAAHGIEQLGLMLARHAEFNRRHPE